MKKWILGLFALIVLAGPLHAGGIGPMLAHWDTSDAEDDQGAGVRVTIDLGPDWNMELRTSWLDSFFRIGDGILFRFEAFPIDMGLSYGFDTGGKAAPYVGAGITYLDINANTIDSDIGNQIEVSIPEEVGIHFIAGVDYPILSIRRRGSSGAPGVLVVAGIHGNETAGLLAVPAILDLLETDRPEFRSSDVTVVAPANPVGVVHGSRYNGSGYACLLENPSKLVSSHSSFGCRSSLSRRIRCRRK